MKRKRDKAETKLLKCFRKTFQQTGGKKQLWKMQWFCGKSRGTCCARRFSFSAATSRAHCKWCWVRWTTRCWRLCLAGCYYCRTMTTRKFKRCWTKCMINTLFRAARILATIISKVLGSGGRNSILKLWMRCRRGPPKQSRAWNTFLTRMGCLRLEWNRQRKTNCCHCWYKTPVLSFRGSFRSFRKRQGSWTR